MEANNIKVSIIVPVYNVEKYLSKCLDSLINQTLKEIEIICINDGTKDNSPAILEAYQQKDKRIKIINQKNQGLCAARNNGIRNATGEYIGLVDSDDWVDKNYFEKLYNAAKKHDSDIAAGDFYRQGKILRSKKLKLTKERFYTDAATKAKETFIPKYNYVWNKIYRRSFIIKYNLFFPEGVVYEDMYWSIRAIQYSNGLVTVPNIFYHYRKVTGSITNQKSWKNQLDYFAAEKSMLEFMKEHDIPILAKYKSGKKEFIKFLGIPVCRVENYYPNITKYKLFGFINLITIERNYLNDSEGSIQ